MEIRPAIVEDHALIVTLWHEGWHDAHGDLVPEKALPYRTIDHFNIWLSESVEDTYVAFDGEGLVGFYALVDAELSHLYVRRQTRGSGVAGKLLAHAERQLLSRRVKVAELYCTAGNTRAQRFYERQGWVLSKTFSDRLWFPKNCAEKIEVLTHHYTKDLIGDDAGAGGGMCPVEEG